MTELDVTLTDFALAALCGFFVVRLWRKPCASRPLHFLWLILFASVAAGSLTGGLVHGFFLDKTTVGYKVLWPLTLLCIGMTASAAWVITGLKLNGPQALKAWSLFALAEYALYALVVLFYSQKFLVVIINYLPPMCALFIACALKFRRNRNSADLWVSAGILLSFVAAGVQQSGIALHREYFNHNSTYHLVQAIGLCALFAGAKRMSEAERIASRWDASSPGARILSP